MIRNLLVGAGHTAAFQLDLAAIPEVVEKAEGLFVNGLGAGSAGFGSIPLSAVSSVEILRASRSTTTQVWRQPISMWDTPRERCLRCRPEIGDGSEFQGADHTASGSAQADASQ